MKSKHAKVIYFALLCIAGYLPCTQAQIIPVPSTDRAFVSDRNVCYDAAIDEYPDSVAEAHPKNSMRVERGKIKVTEHFITPITPAQLNMMREGSIDRCMHKKGWIDSKDWVQGKKTANSGMLP